MLARVRQWPGWHTPALRALAIQFVAAMLTLAIVLLTSRLADIAVSIGLAALLQGALAAVLTAWRGLARWWIAMQALFPLALLTTLALHLPPVLYLAAFLFLLMLYWSTFRTQVPFYPSGPRVWQAVLDLLPADRAPRVIDIGSGLGGLVLALSRARPEGEFIGIELAPLPWIASLLRARMSRSRARFIRGDYDALDLAQFDVVFAYLSPAAMPALWQKVQREMRPGSLLLSYEFPIFGAPPDLTVLPNPHGPVLYGWRR
jgi:SAM-dependent methyltransferase